MKRSWVDDAIVLFDLYLRKKHRKRPKKEQT
jgi:hypothetical protein